MPLAADILGTKQEDCWEGGGEVPGDRARGEGEGGEKGRLGRGRVASSLTSSITEKGKRAERGGGGGSGEEK